MNVKIKQIIPAPNNAYAAYEVDGKLIENKIVCIALLSDDLIVFMYADETGDIHEVDTSHEQFVCIAYK